VLKKIRALLVWKNFWPRLRNKNARLWRTPRILLLISTKKIQTKIFSIFLFFYGFSPLHLTMFNKILGRFSKDMGIDLGTANTLVYVKDKGIVINEPSIVAINLRTDQILAVGEDGKKMVGKTPQHIVAIRPLKEGVISDFEVTEKMLKHFIDKVHRETYAFLPRPRVVIGIPMDVTEVERKAVEDATMSAGAREVYLIEEPLASLIGARVPIHEANGYMVVDIGGGTTDIAVISLGGIVTKRSLRIAGDEFGENIISYVRENMNLLIGERMAEEVKIRIGSVYELSEPLEYKIQGRDMITGLPKEMVVNDTQIRGAMRKTMRLIIESVKATLEETPPEIVADILKRGVYITGGGALIRGVDVILQEETKIPIHIMDDPLTAVVRGTGIILEDIEVLRDVLVSSPSGPY